MSRASRTVGVMGGLGPAATADFHARLVRATPATRDQEHLRLLIDSDPTLPDRNAALAGRGPSPGPALVAMARNLERAGADFLVLVCNAAHAWQDEIRAAVSIPFLSMVDETADEISRLPGHPRRAGVLAADACLQADLYGRALRARAIESVNLDAVHQARFMELLYRIKAGDLGPGMRSEMRALAETLVGDGAQAIVAACTEVPLVLDAADSPLPREHWVSSTDVLVARTIAFAREPAVQRDGRSR